jgi:hypothetical protein
MEKVSQMAEQFIETRINDIINSKATTREKLRQFRGLLDLPPHKDWVSLLDGDLKINIKKDKVFEPYPYLPIGVVETLLKLFFVNPQIIVTDTKQLFNAVLVTVCIKYTCPITGEKLEQHGVGAKQMQVAKGGAAFDLININNAAAEKGAPAAKSLAIKDAADNIGKIFGSDLARDNTLSLSTAVLQYEGWQAFPTRKALDLAMHGKIVALLAACNTPEMVDAVYKDKVAPFLTSRGFGEGLYLTHAAAQKSEIQKSRIELTPVADGEDVGELTENQIQLRQLDNSLDNE